MFRVILVTSIIPANRRQVVSYGSQRSSPATREEHPEVPPEVGHPPAEMLTRHHTQQRGGKSEISHNIYGEIDHLVWKC